jgi:hypothetical protein
MGKNRVLIDYDLETRIGNVIAIGDVPGTVGHSFNELPTSLKSGTIGPTGGATKAVPSSVSIREVTVYAPVANPAACGIGGPDALFPIIAGAGFTAVINDLSQLWVLVPAGCFLFYLAEAY